VPNQNIFVHEVIDGYALIKASPHLIHAPVAVRSNLWRQTKSTNQNTAEVTSTKIEQRLLSLHVPLL
jgi:hypothetical protein